jgi:hypothetical protein
MRKIEASQKRWSVKRAAEFWFALFFTNGPTAATMQYKWDEGFELLWGVFFQGIGAGQTAATIAVFACIAHNRKLGTQNVKQSRTVYRGRLERLRPSFMSPGDMKTS